MKYITLPLVALALSLALSANTAPKAVAAPAPAAPTEKQPVLSEADKQETINWIVDKVLKYANRDRMRPCYDHSDKEYYQEGTGVFEFSIAPQDGSIYLRQGCNRWFPSRSPIWRDDRPTFFVNQIRNFSCSTYDNLLVIYTTSSNLYKESPGIDSSAVRIHFACRAEPNIEERFNKALEHLQLYFKKPGDGEKF